ncbi:MAG TPA: DoxX family protein [Candidatus Paceibacterota bacterium]
MEILGIIGQIIFGAFWIRSGIGHLKNISAMALYTGSRNIPMPKLAVIVTGFLLIFGGLGIILGAYVTYAILALIIFIVPTTFFMHSFWKDTDLSAKMGNEVNFYKNLALFGSLLLLLQFAESFPYSLI